MTPHLQQLIAKVFTWEKIATERGDITLRRDLWHLIDTLYADLAIFRTPGAMQRAEKLLDKMKQTADVLSIKKELGII